MFIGGFLKEIYTFMYFPPDYLYIESKRDKRYFQQSYFTFEVLLNPVLQLQYVVQ